MEEYNGQNPITRAWRSLINRPVLALLPTDHAQISSGFDSMEKIQAWLERHNQYDVYSFDIFDTLLRRRIDPPEVVKQLVAEHISELLARSGTHVSPNEISMHRTRVEEALWRKAESGGKDADYHLDDVVAETLKAIKAERVVGSEQIVDYEIGLEKKAAQPMPGAIEVLSYLKSIGKRVICISDSYLSANQMSSILEYHSFLRYIDQLYVSSDAGKRKSTGRLFRYVMEKEGKKIVHIGDNYDSDYIMPKKLDIKALWFHSRSEQRRKSKIKTLLDGKNKMDYLNTIIRSPVGYKSELQRVGYEVLGPALTVFVHNVAEQARKENVEALFFVARDGYAMKKIYEILQRKIYAESALPSGKYMCLGRLPVRLASLQELTYAEMSEVHRYMLGSGIKNITLGDILRSYGLEASDFIGIANQYGIDFNETIGDLSQDTKLQEFLQSNDFQKAIRAKSDEVRKLLRDYLAGIHFMTRGKVAIVDAVAEGVTKSLLERAFVDDKDFPIVYGYYFNLQNAGIRKADINLDSSQVKGIMSDWRRGLFSNDRPFRILGVFIEIFAHPNHGVTVGYRNVDGKIVPVFRKTPQESQYGVTSQGLDGILSYAKDYSTYYVLHSYGTEDLLEDVKTNIKQWVMHPPKRDVEALKDLFMTSDWPYQSNYTLIKQIKVRDLMTVRGFLNKVASSPWPEATLTLAPMPVLSRLFFRTSSFFGRTREFFSHLT